MKVERPIFNFANTLLIVTTKALVHVTLKMTLGNKSARKCQTRQNKFYM